MARNLSLQEVSVRAHISAATLSRVERDKQGLDLALFLILCKVLGISAHEILESDGAADSDDPLVVKIAKLAHSERVQLWRDLAAKSGTGRGRTLRAQMHNLGEEVDELLAQFEFIRSEIESVQSRLRQR
jgi:transcriptional regulator with XRE-family HTH domain